MAVGDNGLPISFPNQKLIRKYETKHDENHIYFYQSKKAIFTAIKELSHGGLALYLYLNSNQDYHLYGYVQALSPVAIKNAIGLSESSYRRGVKELIEKGYLIPDTPSDTINVKYYFFWEDPNDWRTLKGINSQEDENKMTIKTDSSIAGEETLECEDIGINQTFTSSDDIPEEMDAEQDYRQFLNSLS